MRASGADANADANAIGAFARATKVSRAQRKGHRGWGRRLAIDFWHKATRLDTNVNKKKRQREENPITGQVFYREHWRHVQYDRTSRSRRTSLRPSTTSSTARRAGPFSRTSSCSPSASASTSPPSRVCVPPCTLMRENWRNYHQQRTTWHREYDKPEAVPCGCGQCTKGSAFREASRSLSALRTFVHAPCGTASYPELAIKSGPKSRETVEFYRRACCRTPLPCAACPCTGNKGGGAAFLSHLLNVLDVLAVRLGQGHAELPRR